MHLYHAAQRRSRCQLPLVEPIIRERVASPPSEEWMNGNCQTVNNEIYLHDELVRHFLYSRRLFN